jgi:hypothetical protein
VSVGNLPPGSRVLIQIRYVAELSVDGDAILFSVPASVAPWTKSAALSTVLQVSDTCMRNGGGEE